MHTASLTVVLSPLPDIHDTVSLSEADQPLIDDLVAVLKKHNALHRFGMTLLHQHFPISDDEILVETTDIATRTQTVAPVKKAELAKRDFIETSWRLDTGRAVTACICIVQNNVHTGQHHSRG